MKIGAADTTPENVKCYLNERLKVKLSTSHLLPEGDNSMYLIALWRWRVWNRVNSDVTKAVVLCRLHFRISKDVMEWSVSSMP